MGSEFDIPPDAPAPRLCHIIKRSDFNGYGFNLHAEKNKPGQFIGLVDENSPAEMAGLRHGDRIVEVNGVNISQENHKQVVQRIKAIPNQTKLLVVDQKTEEYYKKIDYVITGSMPNIITRSSKEALRQQRGDGILEEEEDEDDINYDLRVVPDGHSPASAHMTSHYKNGHEDAGSVGSSADKKSSGSDAGSSPRSVSPHPTDLSQKNVNAISVIGNGNRPKKTNWDGLDLNMSAREMRERIGSKKKKDPRKDSRLDFQKKYEIIQTL